MSETAVDIRAWGYSYDGGESFSGPFPTREAALADAREHFKVELEMGEQPDVTLCRCDNVTFADELEDALDIHDIIDRAEEGACESHSNEHEVFHQTREQVQELERRLVATAREWLREFPCRPWFDATDTEEVTLASVPPSPQVGE